MLSIRRSVSRKLTLINIHGYHLTLIDNWPIFRTNGQQLNCVYDRPMLTCDCINNFNTKYITITVVYKMQPLRPGSYNQRAKSMIKCDTKFSGKWKLHFCPLCLRSYVTFILNEIWLHFSYDGSWCVKNVHFWASFQYEFWVFRLYLDCIFSWLQFLPLLISDFWPRTARQSRNGRLVFFHGVLFWKE